MGQYIWKSFDFNGNSADLLDLFKDEPHVFFLDSSQFDPHRGRYSFIGFDPFDVFVHQGKDTLNQLKEKFAEYNDARFSASFSPLTSGVVGCLSYNYGLTQEKINLRSKDDLGLPDCFFGFYDCVLTVDHFTQKLYITSSGLPEKDGDLRKKRAQQRLLHVCKELDTHFYNDRTVEGSYSPVSDVPLDFQCNFSKDQYLTAIQKALDYISCGDIYQVNLSQRFQFDLKRGALDPFILYQALRCLSPTPFGAYMDCGDFQIVSNSPERFLKLDGRAVQTRPMKGTKSRGRNKIEDRKLRGEFLNNAKEKAELLMITDLHRNDLGRVCDYGSVKVKEMRNLEEYKYVFQATSKIEGILREDKDCFDLIQACFPGGSITGCPKIRAMEIIEELEPTGRSMYTGSMGYINFNGNMDFNILIRTLLIHDQKLYFQVGGGIVADSTPENEYYETLIKARAMRTCLESIIGGNVKV